MATRPGMTVTSAWLILSFGLLGNPALQEGSEKEAAMEKIESLVQAEDWKKAIKALKSYRRKFARSDEERQEVEEMLTGAEGSKELQEIEDAYRKKQRARKTAGRLGKFIEKYTDSPDLLERAEELLEVARSEYVLVIEDFEEWGDDDDSGPSRPTGMTRVDDPKLVKHGKSAARWRTGAGWSSYWLNLENSDWSPYTFFCAWIYNEKKGKRPGHIWIDPTAGGEHYYTFLLAIDWVGWKEVRMPLSGRTSKFSRHGNPDWSSITDLHIYHEDYAGTQLEIIIDDIRLEKAVK